MVSTVEKCHRVRQLWARPGEMTFPADKANGQREMSSVSDGNFRFWCHTWFCCFSKIGGNTMTAFKSLRKTQRWRPILIFQKVVALEMLLVHLLQVDFVVLACDSILQQGTINFIWLAVSSKRLHVPSFFHGFWSMNPKVPSSRKSPVWWASRHCLTLNLKSHMTVGYQTQWDAMSVPDHCVTVPHGCIVWLVQCTRESNLMKSQMGLVTKHPPSHMVVSILHPFQCSWFVHLNFRCCMHFGWHTAGHCHHHRWLQQHQQHLLC